MLVVLLPKVSVAFHQSQIELNGLRDHFVKGGCQLVLSLQLTHICVLLTFLLSLLIVTLGLHLDEEVEEGLLLDNFSFFFFLFVLLGDSLDGDVLLPHDGVAEALQDGVSIQFELLVDDCVGEPLILGEGEDQTETLQISRLVGSHVQQVLQDWLVDLLHEVGNIVVIQENLFPIIFDWLAVEVVVLVLLLLRSEQFPDLFEIGVSELMLPIDDFGYISHKGFHLPTEFEFSGLHFSLELLVQLSLLNHVCINRDCLDLLGQAREVLYLVYDLLFNVFLVRATDFWVLVTVFPLAAHRRPLLLLLPHQQQYNTANQPITPPVTTVGCLLQITFERIVHACGSRRSAPQLGQHSLDSCQFSAYFGALSGQSGQTAQHHGAELQESALSQQSVGVQSFPEEEQTEGLVLGNVGKNVQRSDTSHRVCFDCLEPGQEGVSSPEYHRYFIEVLEVAHLTAELVVESPHEGDLGQHDQPLLPDIQQHQYHFSRHSYRSANSLTILSLNSLLKPSRHSPLSPHFLTFSKQALSNQPSRFAKAFSDELSAVSTLFTQASYCPSFRVSAHFRSDVQQRILWALNCGKTASPTSFKMPFSSLDRATLIYYDRTNIMPELPQVENVRRFLAQVLLTPKPKKVKSVRVHYPGIIKSIDAGTFATRLTGQTFIAVSRYGKHLLIQFQDWTVISHLRMEGKYTLWGTNFIPQKHDHIQFLLSNGESLVYNDTRKFGTMHLVPKGTQYDHPSITKLGPEVNNSDTFTAEYLEKVCRKSTKMMKEILLDQTKVCGIGNIYADEILFAAHVSPDRRCKQMGKVEIAEMVERGREIIDAAVENKGTTFRSFSVNHSAGQFQSQLAVYGRGGQQCTRCQGVIAKVQLAGRGTHFCPNCQL